MQTAIVVKKGGKFYVQVSGNGPFAKGIIKEFKRKKDAMAFAYEFNQLESIRIGMIP